MTDRLTILFFGKQNDPCSEALADWLRDKAGDLLTVWSDGYGAQISDAALAWQGDYIFCFRSHCILPGALIARANVAAINFHPGPPEYRGIGCVNYALFDGAGAYGSTAHLIVPEIDAGAILDVRRFGVAPQDDLETVLTKTYDGMAAQARAVIGDCLSEGAAAIERYMATAQQENWSGRLYTRRDMAALYHIPDGADDALVARIARATVIGDWRPYRISDGKKVPLNIP